MVLDSQKRLIQQLFVELIPKQQFYLNLKKVELNIIIDENGIIHVKPEGTEGSECINLMAFLDKIEGFTTVETIKNENYKTKKVQLNTVQKIQK